PRGLDQNAALDLAAFERGAVRNAAERDHRVARHEAVRMALREQALELALEQEIGVVDAVAHLDVVLEGHPLECLGMRATPGLEARERLAEIRARDDARGEVGTVLERTVHALAVEGH